MKVFSFERQLKHEKQQIERERKALSKLTWEVAAKIATYTDEQLYDAIVMGRDANSSHLKFIANMAKEELSERIRKEMT